MAKISRYDIKTKNLIKKKFKAGENIYIKLFDSSRGWHAVKIKNLEILKDSFSRNNILLNEKRALKVGIKEHCSNLQ